MEYVFLDKINSTQDYIKKCLSEGKRNIAVLVRIQTGGRGRSGRVWESPLGGLWFSFDTEFTDDVITLKMGVAVREACSEMYGCELFLKWPNDLILNGKKVAGILCERVGSRVVVGVGINTNNSGNMLEGAVSFINETGIMIDNEKLMRNIINKFQNYDKNVIDEFRKNMAFIGEERYISAIDKRARITGITDEGHLIVDDGDKEMNVFIGEILS